MKRTALCLGVLLVLLLWSGAAAADDDGWRTDVLFLESMQAGHAATLYERVLGTPPGVRVAPGRDAGTLVVRDTPARLDRFRALLGALDGPDRGMLHIYVRPVIHRTPSGLAALARDAFDAAGEAPLHMVPDDRSRNLVVQTAPETYRKLDRLLRRLDVRERTPNRRRQR
ncbi:MAG: hypothetical protein ACQEXJ_11485 [Myxococcota bacterium]